mmetsp:Transcript_64692/g.89520  ORF Transcript_64692/g.89520 Transcript_64692/m.89520 type:complete len:112 (+) Transcript_64692:53-388(+)
MLLAACSELGGALDPAGGHERVASTDKASFTPAVLSREWRVARAACAAEEIFDVAGTRPLKGAQGGGQDATFAPVREQSSEVDNLGSEGPQEMQHPFLSSSSSSSPSSMSS